MAIKGFSPPLWDLDKGILHSSESISLIKNNLRQLLLTRPGERVMLPLYGNPLYDYIYDKTTNLSEQEVYSILNRTITAYGPNVTVVSVKVNQNEGEITLICNAYDEVKFSIVIPYPNGEQQQ